MKVVFDTGSDWLTVESNDCDNCLGDNFDIGKSDKFKYVSESNLPLTYGSATLDGNRVTDKVCFTQDDSVCLDSFEWYLITH